MYMKLKDGKSKVLTFSYDDGVVQDKRLVALFNRYGLKGTFNINTGIYAPEELVREKERGRLKRTEAQALYAGHEVAVHTLNHPFLGNLASDEAICEVLEDRRNIERDFGCVARGMAYPYNSYTAEQLPLFASLGIVYSRTTIATNSFAFPQNWLTLNPTCHHNSDRLFELAERFVTKSSRYPVDNWLFYVWGHSYEFDDNDNWDVIERFAETVSGREDVWYATNIEIYDYVRAYESLRVSVDRTRIENPTATDVWVLLRGKTYCVHAGETLCLPE